MDLADLSIGILHSIVGKNDGVSIVIDQTVKAMVQHMAVPLGNIYFLAAHAPARFNTELNEVFWHKNDANKYVVQHWSDAPSTKLEQIINKHALYAKKVIEQFIDTYQLDLLIAHNTSHPYNFTGAVGLGMYLEEQRKKGIIAPRVLLWWHDSYFERERFANPNKIIKKYLQYLPGINTDGVIFINSQQPPLAQRYFKQYKKKNIDRFFEHKTAVIPNTCSIPWDWEKKAKKQNAPLAPPPDQYNKSFFKDVGLLDMIKNRGYNLKNTLVLLQHTRIVPRKRIDTAIDFAFKMRKKYMDQRKDKCVVLLVSGHSGDEQSAYREYLEQYHKDQQEKYNDPNVLLLFGEHLIYPSREIIVDRKFYKFADIPAIVAAAGGLGTYFSEVEGFGNNLLEMLRMGLPVVINRYEIFDTDLAQYKFKLPATTDCKLPQKLIDQCYRLCTDDKLRYKHAKHNLQILADKFSHQVIGDKMSPLLQNLFKYA